MTLRTRGVALGAVLVGALAGPAVTGAVAKTTHSTRRTVLTRAEKRELRTIEALRANDTSTDPPPGAGLAVQDLIQNLQFDLSSQGIQALLGDFPLVGDYG
jgi:hypothetical protein